MTRRRSHNPSLYISYPLRATGGATRGSAPQAAGRIQPNRLRRVAEARAAVHRRNHGSHPTQGCDQTRRLESEGQSRGHAIRLVAWRLAPPLTPRCSLCRLVWKTSFASGLQAGELAAVYRWRVPFVAMSTKRVMAGEGSKKGGRRWRACIHGGGGAGEA